MHTRSHTHPYAHLIKGKQQSEEDNLLLCNNAAVYITPLHALNHAVSHLVTLQESNMDAFLLQSSSHLPPLPVLISTVWSHSMLITL